MSYTVEIPAESMGTTFSYWDSSKSMAVTTFAGGKHGRMVQISTGGPNVNTNQGGFACLTMKQLDLLIEVLQHARRETLGTHPLNGQSLPTESPVLEPTTDGGDDA